MSFGDNWTVLHKLKCVRNHKIIHREGADLKPEGVFTKGTQFHPLPFLGFIREVYEKVVAENDTEGLTMEQEAFLTMFKMLGRVITSANDAILFKLFQDFTIPADDPTPANLIVEENGVKYLRIDALQDSTLST
ncbi:hypothetical protein C8R44DRAFT_748545 [Mycena epipterygia]|nr:hypothetical protein C8R44DRAFT_748545 [Mycena epipterygia]